MLLKNTGDKIINVGRTILMPGEEKSFPDGMVGAGALSVLISKGFLKVSMEKKETPVEKEPEPAPAPTPFAAAPSEEKLAAEEKKPVRKSVKKAE